MSLIFDKGLSSIEADPSLRRRAETRERDPLPRLFDQEVRDDPARGTRGDCMRACVRTLLQDPLPALPHPVADDGTWNGAFFDTLEDEYGWTYRFALADSPDFPGDIMPRFVIAAGHSSRTLVSGSTHAVIWDRARDALHHDPHPSRDGLLFVTSYWWLIPDGLET